MNHLRHITCTLLTLLAASAWALVPIEEPERGQGPTGVAPLYFGPNAFPVPEMGEGRTNEQLTLELAGDYYCPNWTADLFARAVVPLFTRWANLCIWMPVHEWYQGGHGAGDVYVATDMQLLSGQFGCFSTYARRHWLPDLRLRAAIKTASGGQFGQARHYDAPGYWFDLELGENLLPEQLPVSLRLSALVGFLCWQTDVARQNDATQYGVRLAMDWQYLSFATDLRGYSGWEHYGDRPIVWSAQLQGHAGRYHPFLRYQYGLRDYPFHQLRLGMAVTIDILKRKQHD